MPPADSTAPVYIVLALALLAVVIVADWLDTVPAMDEDDDIDYP